MEAPSLPRVPPHQAPYQQQPLPQQLQFRPLAMLQKRHHWRHFFGGTALLLLVVQFVSGLVLTMFYSPHLNEAYASVQRLYNELAAVAWVRDGHRWAALLLVVASILHLLRSLLKKDFVTRPRRTSWLTGFLLLLPLLGFLVTGMILPWEWRGYWFMEMVPNYLGGIPLIGPPLSDFLISAFTLNRAFVAHVVVLPALTLVLVDIHALARVRKRIGGVSAYLLERAVFAVPFLLLLALLVYALPMPSQDPAIIPQPLDGEGIPTAEWFVLIFYVPYLYLDGLPAALVGFFVPLVVFLFLTALPWIFGDKAATGRAATAPDPDALSRKIAATRLLAPLRAALGPRRLIPAVGALVMVVAALAFFGPFYAATHVSPTMGCNSCHNVSAGTRMGKPPDTFKDRVMNPNLKNSKFMVEHWFYPQVVW